MKSHGVCVSPLPVWLDLDRLLGPGPWQLNQLSSGALEAHSALSRGAAADLAARLRGVALDGSPLQVRCTPALPRAAVRAGRAAEARRHRDTTPGFLDRRARVDREGRLSLTPEPLALQLGRWAAGRRVVDACAGCGGNAIGFARAGCQVVAIERDPGRLALARHNASVYGVADRIRFIQGDARREVPALRPELLFVDPPWGDAARGDGCRLADFPLLAALRGATRQALWAKLPSSFETASLAECRPTALFGQRPGDQRRIKFLLLRSD